MLLKVSRCNDDDGSSIVTEARELLEVKVVIKLQGDECLNRPDIDNHQRSRNFSNGGYSVEDK
jgi:hypothetical protein